MKKGFTIQQYGVSTVLINWTPKIALDIHTEVLRVDHLISSQCEDLIVETIIAYHSVMVQLKNSCEPQKFINRLNKLVMSSDNEASVSTHLFRIPVCYDPEFGLDLTQIAKEKNLSTSKIVELHTEIIYPVFFIGFLPGFPYLGGLVDILHTPRKERPRKRIMAGSVGIGGSQTGIYPQESPGGWNLIGRTPIQLFDSKLQPPSVFRAGDRVQFYSITRNKFDQISEAIQKEEYKVEKEVWND